MSDVMPTLFVSHGAPSILIEDLPARTFLRSLAKHVPPPSAILVATAHWMSDEPLLSADPAPRTEHDFGGFPETLYRLRYPAPGAPALARRAAALLRSAGLAAATVDSRPRDHGSWVPLMFAWPDARIPVVELSVQPARDAPWHFRLGRALAPLRQEGVLIVGSGAATHDLRRYFAACRSGVAPDAAPDPTAQAFADWLADRIADGDLDDLLRWREHAPHAHQCHPTPEHLLPLFVAAGAGIEPEGDAEGTGLRGRRLHASFDRGVLAMDAYRFG